MADHSGITPAKGLRAVCRLESCGQERPVSVSEGTSADRSPDPGCPDVLGVRLEAGPKAYRLRVPGYVRNRTPLVALSHALGRRFKPALIRRRIAFDRLIPALAA
jgi:hypothetical protein